jgi:hypothetical protein
VTNDQAYWVIMLSAIMLNVVVPWPYSKRNLYKTLNIDEVRSVLGKHIISEVHSITDLNLRLRLH